MSLSNVSRRMIDGLLPPGPLWVPEKDGDLDLFFDGLSLSMEDARVFLEKLKYIRDPYNTPILSDLEREYGIITKDTLTEEERIAALAVKIYEKGGTGSEDNLESALRGFDVQVHQNSPAVDPNIILNQTYQLVAGDPLNAYVGDPGAYCGQAGGYLLVNGPIYSGVPVYLGLGDPNAYVGDPLAVTGYFQGLRPVEKTYNIPTDPDSWPFIFFVGGDATRADVVEVVTSDGKNVVTSTGVQVTTSEQGQLLSIEPVEIPANRRQEFETIILTYKPLFTWAGLVVVYV